MVGTAGNNVLIPGILLFVIYIPFDNGLGTSSSILFAGDEVVVVSLHHDEVYNLFKF